MVRLKALICALVLVFLTSTAASAQSTLITLVCDDAAPRATTVWPSMTTQPIDQALRNQLTRYGFVTIDPALRSDVRFSPIVYAAGALSNTNARNLAGLYGAQRVLNGKLHWNCQNESDATTNCTLTASLELCDVASTHVTALNPTVSGRAATLPEAQSRAISLLASALSLPLAKSAIAPRDNEIPHYLPKPVLVLDALPDADTLVALRKSLKRIDGVEEVAERWLSNGVLALELNPSNPIMSFESFNAIVSVLLSSSLDNFIVRETRRNPNGIAVEVVNY